MENYNKKAQEIWNVIKSNNLGEVSAVAVIEKELRNCIQNERELIVDSIAAKLLKETKPVIPIRAYLALIFAPRFSFKAIVDHVARESIKLIRARVYR